MAFIPLTSAAADQASRDAECWCLWFPRSPAVKTWPERKTDGNTVVTILRHPAELDDLD